MAASPGTCSRLTKATVICLPGCVPLLFICLEDVVQFDSNGYICSKGFRRIDIGE